MAAVNHGDFDSELVNAPDTARFYTPALLRFAREFDRVERDGCRSLS